MKRSFRKIPSFRSPNKGNNNDNMNGTNSPNSSNTNNNNNNNNPKKRNNRRNNNKNDDLNLEYRNHHPAPPSSPKSQQPPSVDHYDEYDTSPPIVMKKSTETLEEAWQRVKREQYESNKRKKDIALRRKEQQLLLQQQQQQQEGVENNNTGGGGRWGRGKKKGKQTKKSGGTVLSTTTPLSTSTTSTVMSTTSNMKKDSDVTASASTSTFTSTDTTIAATNSIITSNRDASSNSGNNNINPTPLKNGSNPNTNENHALETTNNDVKSSSSKSNITTPTKQSIQSPQQLPPPLPKQPNTINKGPRRAMSNSSIKKDESKLRKILIRLLSGISMVGVFVSVMYCGHIYLCSLIFFTEVMLFRELLTVRYNTFFHIIEETIPLFRTTQWMWFITAIFYTYSDFVVEVIKSNTSLHHLLEYARFQTGFAFLLYSTTFVVSIVTMHKDHIRFQINQLCWTILVLCLTVGQLKYVMHNVYNGLIWFALPIMLVVFNDSFAWLAGVTCGRKFIQKPLSGLSPNKTWEGFLGGWIGTMIAGWHLSSFMAQFTWMTCPTNNFSLFPDSLDCELDPIFLKAKHIFPSQLFEIVPQAIVHMFPGVVDICMVNGNVDELTACVSGMDGHTHHHFELVLKDFYPVQLHALGLSLFASFVAPFGGFLASAIKRAYGLKDFGSFFPGHGGMMDRMDCQFLMALCTWVHYNTFVKMATVSVPKMIYMFNSLNDAEKKEFMEKIVGDAVQVVGGECQVSFD